MPSATAVTLRILAPFAVLLGPQAMANAGPYTQVRGWSIYRNETNCSAYMMFDNDEALGFTYDAPARSLRITFSDARMTWLSDGDNPTFDVLLRQPDGTVENSWESTVFSVTVEEDGRRNLSSRWLGPPALDDFRAAAVVGFYEDDRELRVFSLAGTGAALNEVEDCARRLRNHRQPEPSGN